MRKNKEVPAKKIHSRNLSVQRMLYVIAIMMVSLIFCSIMVSRAEILLDEIVCLLMVLGVLLVVATSAMVSARYFGYELYSGTSLKYAFFAIFLHWILVFFCNYLPELYLPTFLIPFILLPFIGEEATLLIGIYDVMLLSVLEGKNLYFIFLQTTLLLAGTIIARMYRDYRDEKPATFLSVIIFCVAYFLPMIQHYLQYHGITLKVLLLVSIIALAETLLIVFVYPLLYRITGTEEETLLNTILSEDFGLREEISLFSKKDYSHAMKVSKYAAKAAKVAGCNVKVAEAGALYYRLPKVYGEDGMEYAVKVMENMCFPHDVIDIVYEYNAKYRKPSSPESALVHMIDQVITRIELMDHGVGDSSWNQDMVIYQTLNEITQNGLYDESGMSINQYLKARDYLLREDLKK